MVDISKEKKEEILDTYNKGKHDLFNWCEEYKQWINDCVQCCVSSEWDYILKKSYEDRDAPFSYEDVDLFDSDSAIETLVNDFEDEDKKEDFVLLANDPDTYNRRVKTRNDFDMFLKSLDKDEVKIVYEDLGYEPCETEIEIYEWWIITDPLAYQLENQGEVILNGAWGRCTSGQSITLDYECIKAFLAYLEGLYKY